jgi:superfamily II DNA/RNA helicase
MTSPDTNATGATTEIEPDLVAAPDAKPSISFAELGVRDEIVRALAETGKEYAFAIQELTLPLALAGDDLIGQARTGMGKTLAFGVPLLHRISSDQGRPLNGTPRALIVVPTRELCLQVYNDLELASKYLRAVSEDSDRKFVVTSIYGGRPYEPQIEALRKGVDVVVGTPGRAAGGPAGPPAARQPVGAGARRGRRDARPGLPARHRADPAADPR